MNASFQGVWIASWQARTSGRKSWLMATFGRPWALPAELPRCGLNEQESARAANNGWRFSLLQRPAYAAAAAVLVIAIVFGGLWASGVFVTTPEATVLKVEAATDQTTYQTGETVRIQVSLKNVTGEELNFNEFPPILSLMKKDNNQAAYTFAAGTDTKSLAPDETTTFVLLWNQRDAFGKQAVSGSYYIELEDLYYQGNTVKLTLDKPVEFIII
jgi:hypothetical protein